MRKTVWIVGGDGWAYDIGAGGLDHILGSGRNVNVLVLDTEVYSNTGGQASKATPGVQSLSSPPVERESPRRISVSKRCRTATSTSPTLPLVPGDIQTVKAMLEAEAWPGVSLVIAYSTCIAHGFEMGESMTHQKAAVHSGHWPLYRYQPGAGESTQPFQLDSAAPTVPYADFAWGARRGSRCCRRSDPERATQLLALAQSDVTRQMASLRATGGCRENRPVHLASHTIAETEDES